MVRTGKRAVVDRAGVDLKRVLVDTMVSPHDARGASPSRIVTGGTEHSRPPAERGPMFDRCRGDRLGLAFSYDAEGHVAIALKGIGSRTVGRLELVPGGSPPFDSWRAETYGRRWRIDAESRDSGWGFYAREGSSDKAIASARRRGRWRLGSYDLWLTPDRLFRLRCSYLRDGALRNETGDRIATIALGGRAGYVKTWPAAKSDHALALLLLLTVRVALFEQASRVALPSAAGGGYA